MQICHKQTLIWILITLMLWILSSIFSLVADVALSWITLKSLVLLAKCFEDASNELFELCKSVFDSVSKMEEEVEKDVKDAEQEVADSTKGQLLNTLRELISYAKVRAMKISMLHITSLTCFSTFICLTVESICDAVWLFWISCLSFVLQNFWIGKQLIFYFRIITVVGVIRCFTALNTRSRPLLLL